MFLTSGMWALGKRNRSCPWDSNSPSVGVVQYQQNRTKALTTPEPPIFEEARVLTFKLLYLDWRLVSGHLDMGKLLAQLETVEHGLRELRVL